MYSTTKSQPKRDCLSSLYIFHVESVLAIARFKLADRCIPSQTIFVRTKPMEVRRSLTSRRLSSAPSLISVLLLRFRLNLSSQFLLEVISLELFPSYSLTGIRLWSQICDHLYFELRDCLITFLIFVLSQHLITRNVRELFGFNRGISHLNEACRIDDVSRGSLLCYEILTNI